jgi:7,8-dihydroneopterin aldolase/epimerase/oxygenase
MAIIALEGVRFFARHGYYEEERIIGNDFILDVYVDADTQLAAVADDLFSTINYETLYLICQSEMRKPAKLLESLAQKIANRISDHFEHATGVKVRLRKLAPPLGGRVDSAFVEVATGSFGPSSFGDAGDWFNNLKDEDF